MPSKGITLLGEGDKEILDFLEKARASDGLRVQIGADVFVVKVHPDSASKSGRDFLTRRDA
jgi:hypothetical protein